MSLSGLNLDVFKVPLGFIRIVQLPVVIIAFATACDYSGTYTYDAICKQPQKNKTVTIKWSYPFDLAGGSSISKNSCDTKSTELTTFFTQSYNSAAQFYVFIGVMTFLFILVSAWFYAAKWEMYESDPRVAKADCGITVALAMCWVAGWIAWAADVDNIKGAVSADDLQTLFEKRDGACANDSVHTCQAVTVTGNTGTLTISALAGFACVIAILGNVWFVWKETEWFKLRQSSTDMAQIPGQTLSGQSTPGQGPPPQGAPFPGATY